ncbi:MAG: 50S ribosomal protein L10, partial [Deltaproteobacteria bacterium]|nr:50S ribosomal protein L10 [Deltaproteobacteria bacterium]
MAIKKADKAKVVDDIRLKFEKAGAVFVAEYQGIKALNMTDVRSSLRAASVELKIVRNTL